MKSHTKQTLQFENPTDTGRPLKMSARAGWLEIRIGKYGLADATITLNAEQTTRLVSWLLEVTR